MLQKPRYCQIDSTKEKAKKFTGISYTQTVENFVNKNK